MPDRFHAWFDESSGYALHRTAKRRFSLTHCCEQVPQDSGKQLLFPDSGGRMEWFPLYRCSNCKRWFVKQGEFFCPVDNLLKYQIR